MSTCGQIRLATSQKGEVGLHKMYRPPSSSSCELLLFIGQDPYCLDRPLALSIFGQIKLATSQSQRLTCITSIAPSPPPHVREVSRFPAFLRGAGAGVSVLVFSHKPTRLVANKIHQNIQKKVSWMFSVLTQKQVG